MSHKARVTHHSSPLRYPGGKGKLAPYVKSILRENCLLDMTYVEPFAGGAGVALSLLMHGYVKRVVINDLSRPISAFWSTALHSTERFCEAIMAADLSISEWTRQRALFRAESGVDDFDLGFATFYLNRTNHSGVLNGGMIGGLAQKSAYGLDARFNRMELCARVRRIAKHRKSITLLAQDAVDLIGNITDVAPSGKFLLYADPPYFVKGRDLYYDFFSQEDHVRLRDGISCVDHEHWIVSYDNVSPIRELYSDYEKVEYDLSYSVKNGRAGREIMFFSPRLTAPELVS